MDGGSTETTFTAGFLFAGIGAGALGFLDAKATLRGQTARFRSLGGVDFDEVACRSFERLTKSPALCADLATMTTTELRAFWPEAPRVVFLSPPCKGFSGLMSPAKSATPKYQAMNRLAISGVRLLLDTWGASGPDLILIENVPRIATRGESLVKEIRALLRRAGYVTHEGSHDCGEVGGLAQHRQRFLMVARHAARCPVFLYQPVKQRVRGCGEVLGELPLPGAPEAGRLHRLPAISLRTWLRLAAIRPGKDWRDIETLDGEPRPAWARYTVAAWANPTGAVAGSGTNSAWGVADVRVPQEWQASVLGVVPWTAPFGTVTGRGGPTNGAFSVADLRVRENFKSRWGIIAMDRPARTVVGGPANWYIADVRVSAARYAMNWRVLSGSAPSPTITGTTDLQAGAPSIADLRLTCAPWSSSGVLGVLAWSQPSWTITASGDLWTGWNAVSDPRVPNNPRLAVRWHPTDLDDPPPYIPVIPGRGDGSWHRPLTLLERAVLQGLPAVFDGAPLDLEGTLSKVSEHIGNAVPVQAAAAIAGEMLRTLTLAATGAFMLSAAGGVWVKKARNGVYPLYTPAPTKAVGRTRRARKHAKKARAPQAPTPVSMEVQ